MSWKIGLAHFLLGVLTPAIGMTGLHASEVPSPMFSEPQSIPNTSPETSSGAPSYNELLTRLSALEEEVARQKESSFNEPAGGYAEPIGEEVIQCEHSFLNSLGGSPCQCPTCQKKAEKEKKTYPNVRMTGVVQIDAGSFSQDTASHEQFGDIQNGADFRRTRLAATGDLWENAGYIVEMDFSFPGHPSFVDVWMELRDLGFLGNFRVGHWRVPFGMDEMTSVRDLTFLERNSGFAFAPFRQISIGLYDSYEESATTWAVSMFRFPTDQYGDNIGDDGVSVAGRLSTLIYENASRHELFHLGGSYGLIVPTNGASQFRSPPEFTVQETAGALAPSGVPSTVPFFVDTGVIPTNHYQIFNIETAYPLRSMIFRGESRWSYVDQIGGDPLTFFAAYGQLSYILTGEIQPYSRTGGYFTRIKPKNPFKPGCGWGAWEAASRLSWLDLNDKNIQGGKLLDYTAGLNWYLNNNTKFQFNYIYSTVEGSDYPNNHTSIVAMRAQYDF